MKSALLNSGRDTERRHVVFALGDQVLPTCRWCARSSYYYVSTRTWSYEYCEALPYLFSAGAAVVVGISVNEDEPGRSLRCYIHTNLALAASLASVGLVGSLAYQGTLQTIVAQEGKVEGI